MMTNLLKAGALATMGLFLYSRYVAGTLFYYINERFTLLVLAAAVGFVLVALCYWKRPDEADYDHHHHHEHDDHQPAQFSGIGIFLIVLPVVLGFLVPPKPLGTAAMINRNVNIESLTSAAAPEGNAILSKPKIERNVLDWIVDFRTTKDPPAFDGDEARVTGFVYRDDRFGEEEFMVARFVVSCCAADASPLGLVVRWSEGVTLADDEWVEVKGHFEAGQFAGEAMPILIADSVTLTDVPERPYLYAF